MTNSSLVIFAVVSGKGGVGKTMITAALAKELSLASPTLLVDLDFFNRGLTGLMPGGKKICNVERPRFIRDCVHVEGDWELRQYSKNLYCISYPDLSEEEIRRFATLPVKELAEGLEAFIKKTADACSCLNVVLDCHGGPDNSSFAACLFSTYSLLVSEPDRVTLFGTLNFVRQLNRLKGEKNPRLYLVFNKVIRKFNGKFLKELYENKLAGIFEGRPLLAIYPMEMYLTKEFEKTPFLTEVYPYSDLARKTHLLLNILLSLRYPERLPPMVLNIPPKHGERKKIYYSTGQQPWLLSVRRIMPVIVVMLLILFVFQNILKVKPNKFEHGNSMASFHWKVPESLGLPNAIAKSEGTNHYLALYDLVRILRMRLLVFGKLTQISQSSYEIRELFEKYPNLKKFIKDGDFDDPESTEETDSIRIDDGVDSDNQALSPKTESIVSENPDIKTDTIGNQIDFNSDQVANKEDNDDDLDEERHRIWLCYIRDSKEEVRKETDADVYKTLLNIYDQLDEMEREVREEDFGDFNDIQETVLEHIRQLRWVVGVNLISFTLYLTLYELTVEGFEGFLEFGLVWFFIVLLISWVKYLDRKFTYATRTRNRASGMYLFGAYLLTIFFLVIFWPRMAEYQITLEGDTGEGFLSFSFFAGFAIAFWIFFMNLKKIKGLKGLPQPFERETRKFISLSIFVIPILVLFYLV